FVTSLPPLSAPPDRSIWRAVFEHPLFLGLLLLAPIVWLLVPVPIDETRYLAVAWEMRQTGEFLVPHLNGATYAHKPPMLFWLINAGWLLTGVHAWTARAITLLCSAAIVVLLQQLVLRLTGSAATARTSMWIVLGTLYFAAFANAIMFDVPLTACVVLAVHGVLDLVDARNRRGVCVLGAAIGLGILVKGPAVLLPIAFVALGAPWWARDAVRKRRARYFGAFALSFVLGVAIALAWAIPAALHGGDAYARAIFLNQTFDRIEAVKGASTHGRPWWWYFAIFPLMLLPWPLVIRGSWSKLRALLDDRGMRLALVWVVPTFIAFSLIGGKQPHYLLPAIPAVALALAIALEHGAAWVRSGLFALLLIGAGIAFALMPHYAATRAAYAYVGDTSVWWGIAVAVLGAIVVLCSRHARQARWPALATLVFVLIVKLAVVQGPGDRYDMGPVSAQVRAAQDRGQPIAHLGWHHGAYEFAGRMTEPLTALDTNEQFAAWAKLHPDGLVISFYRRFRFRATPLYTRPFRGGEVSIWSVRDALASGIDPSIQHTHETGEDESDD
ncbi:MAG: glycosyltransferase family 39 protein, partial [Dokdonella sp.]